MKRVNYNGEPKAKKAKSAMKRGGKTFPPKFQPEYKFLDTGLGGAIGTVAATLEKVNLNVVAQGDTESNRNGRKITVTAVQTKGRLTLAAATAAANTSCAVRLMLVQDRQTNNAEFSSTALLESDNINSFNNLAFKKRFRVLWSHTIDLYSGGAAPSGAALTFSEAVQSWECYKGNLNIPVEFDNSDTDGAIDTQTGNSLYFCAVASTADLVTVSGSARIRFVDY